MNDLRLKDLFSLDPLDDALNRYLRPLRAEFADRTPQIKLDVHESDTSYTVKAEIPGVKKEDVDVRIDGKQVTISAEIKKQDEEKEGNRILRMERRYGYASRSFTLDSAVDEAKAEAKYHDGILELTLPKRTTTSSSRLPVR